MNRRNTQSIGNSAEMDTQQSIVAKKTRSRSISRRNTELFENSIGDSTQRSKIMNRRNTLSLENVMSASKQRSKNFTEAECEILVQVCDRYYDVITKNSNREVDKMAKNQAWEKIKHAFDASCHTKEIDVSKSVFILPFASVHSPKNKIQQ